MRCKWIVGAAGIISLIVVGISSYSFAGDKATPGDVVQKVQAAVSTLEKSKGSDVSAFDNPKGPWVFKDSYVYIQDCAKGTMAAHPFAPQLIGKNLTGLQDVKGNFLTAEICAAGKKSGGGWAEYWFPKPGEKTPSRKVGYALQVPGTSLVATAGIYSDTLKVSDLDKQLKK
ncbi:MAG: cache domain-containing protein [Syntrophobacteraceae bacterium]